jgi:EAL domain-containing protein (putative c-di-GMP-specific phosphodiesterase class I)
MIMGDTLLGGFLSAQSAAGPEGRSPVDAILDAVRQHLGMEIAFASRYVGDRREFTHISTDLPLPHRPGDGDPKEDSYCWHILHGRLPELIHNAADLPFAQTLPITGALPVGCHMDIPLRLRDGSVYGSFCCLSRNADYSLTGRDLATMRAFADLAVTQIEMELDAVRSRTETVSRISDAIAAGQPAVAMQPIHNLATGAPIGVEALARFPGGASPDRWFADASAAGLGVVLELAAVDAAMGALPYVPAPAYLAVNASPDLIISGRLEELVAAAPKGRMVVEITEHEQVANYVALRSALAPLKDYCRIAIDDVGAGYSGLRHILDLGPDILKLDMSLTRDVDRDPARRALIRAMVDFAGTIACSLVAEGIERPGELEVLRDLGVAAGQGWHFSRALPPVAAQHYLLGVSRDADMPPVQAGRRAAA